MPERIKKIQLRLLISAMPFWVFVKKTIPQDMINTTNVRMAVARVEFTPSMPILAKMDVSAAKMEEPRAKRNHIDFLPPRSYESIFDDKLRTISGYTELPSRVVPKVSTQKGIYPHLLATICEPILVTEAE